MGWWESWNGERGEDGGRSNSVLVLAMRWARVMWVLGNDDMLSYVD